jgi:hypothetical protein
MTRAAVRFSALMLVAAIFIHIEPYELPQMR